MLCQSVFWLFLRQEKNTQFLEFCENGWLCRGGDPRAVGAQQCLWAAEHPPQKGGSGEPQEQAEPQDMGTQQLLISLPCF